MNTRGAAVLLLGCLAGVWLVASPAGDGARAKGNALPTKRAPRVQYHFDVWTTDNGLPQNSINDLLQTRDGFLWMATYDGLARYDGVKFTFFNAGNRDDLKQSRFAQLFEDRDGRLWIITEDFKLLQYRDRRFRAFTTADGLPDNQVRRLRAADDGAILFETGKGVFWWHDGKFVSDDPLASLAQPAPQTNAEIGFPMRPGVVWHFDNGALHRVENRQVTRHLALDGLVENDVKAVWETRRGEVWVGITDGILLRFADGKRLVYGKPEGLPGDRINVIREDRQGNIWIGLQDNGLMRFKDGQLDRYTTADGLAGNSIGKILEDREGVLWFGTTGGLCRLRDQIISAYSIADGLTANNIYPICQSGDGAIWIGGWRGLSCYRDGVFQSCGEPFGIKGDLVTALLSARDGGLWVGTFGGGARRFKDGETLEYKNELPHTVVRALCEDREGAVWIGTGGGLAKYQDGALKVFTAADGLPELAIYVIHEDRRGDIWIGTQAGLYRYRDGRFENFPQAESVNAHIVRAVYEDSDGVYWIGTYDAGLTRLKDGQFTSITVKQGLFNNGVFQILEDAGGNFWMSCNLGIYRVSRRELNDYAEGRVKAVTAISYGKSDGMLSSECNGGAQPAGIRSQDGKLWFPTQGGVVVVDPQAVPVSAQAPSVVVEDILLNNQPIGVHAALEIAPGAENFEIHYTALSFIMSERIRFRYKLEGLDTDWVEADTRRVAYYSHVPPGSYTFRVIAANRDGVWNLEGAQVAIRVIPPFWKTAWFLALVGVTLVGLLVAGFKLRISQLERARRAQEAFSQQLIHSQESERQRIAAELHDSLGQHLLIIKNSALLGLNALGGQPRGKEQLDDISLTASQAIEEVREISYNLRPYQLDDLGLTKAIEAILARVAHASALELVTHLDSIDGLFSPEAEINLYRIVQESLNNIVKHAAASRAEVLIRRRARPQGGSIVDITIEDNGRGFNPERSGGGRGSGFGGFGGFGLKGIAERARILGARCLINSTPGQGTTISLTLEVEEPVGKAPVLKASADDRQTVHRQTVNQETVNEKTVGESARQQEVSEAGHG